MSAPFAEYLESRSRVAERAIKKFLPKAGRYPAVIHEAMRYSVLAGGKRLRPVLVMAAAEACGGSASKVLPTACALEFIHTYSLIHDDLPAMDDDDLRRGKPTSHKVYGEDIAILAGDALLTYAFEVLAANAHVTGIDAKNVARTLQFVAQKAGTLGMIGGQVADIKADGGRWKSEKNPRQLLAYIHEHKTSALLVACVVSGARLSGASERQVRCLEEYAKYLGLAFQVRDDILDRVGDKKKLGKKGSDAANQKLTYPQIFGLERSAQLARNLSRKAHNALRPFGSQARRLHEIADYVLSRDH